MREVPRLYLHGFLGCAEDAAAWIDIQDGDLVLDLPGSGPNPEMGPLEGDPDGGFDRCLAWIEDQVRAAGVDQVDVVGYSMGGRLAYGLLVRGNIDICCAALIAATPGMEDPDERAARAAKDDALAANLEAATSFDEWLDGWYAQPLFGDIANAPGYSAMRERRLLGSRPALAQALRNMSIGRQPSYWDELPNIDIDRLLLVAGDEDKKFLSVNIRASEMIPRAAMARIHNVAHAASVEHPALLGQLVSGFLE